MNPTPDAKLAYCRSCRADPSMEEYHYHEECLDACKQRSHVWIPLHDYVKEKNQISIILDDCYDDDRVTGYMNTKTLKATANILMLAEFGARYGWAINIADEIAVAANQASAQAEIAKKQSFVFENAWKVQFLINDHF